MSDRRNKTSHAVAQSPLAGIASVRGDADEPMTEEQAVIMRELAEQAGEPMDGGLTRGQAEERIAALEERLEARAGR